MMPTKLLLELKYVGLHGHSTNDSTVDLLFRWFLVPLSIHVPSPHFVSLPPLSFEAVKVPVEIECARGQPSNNGSCSDGDNNDGVKGGRWMGEAEDSSPFERSFIRSPWISVQALELRPGSLFQLFRGSPFQLRRPSSFAGLP
ncbi:unnamed protein product [Citrullus colocynthis]|uniref:Uncharacterized protein n=1 Tax=Citrullus colocynthis TaxID=252529 RepID=A0ABP0XZ71_9ROSI